MIDKLGNTINPGDYVCLIKDSSNRGWMGIGKYLNVNEKGLHLISFVQLSYSGKWSSPRITKIQRVDNVLLFSGDLIPQEIKDSL